MSSAPNEAISKVRSPMRDSILAALANYIDAGSIVTGSAALALWAELNKMTPTTIGS